MAKKIGFQNEKYLKQQTQEIWERVERFNNKFDNQASAKIFKNKLERRDIKVYTHPYTKGYPMNIDIVVSKNGYGANEHIPLLPNNIIESISKLKGDILQSKTVSLNLVEARMGLSVIAASNPTAELAVSKLKELRGCEVHITHIPSPGDEAGLKRLGVNLTSDPNFPSKNLFMT